MHHPTDRIVHTTAFVKPVVEHWLEQETREQCAVHDITNITFIVFCYLGYWTNDKFSTAQLVNKMITIAI